MTTKEAILTSINTHQGIKAVELVLDVLRLSNPFLDGEEYHKELESLVESGEIVELEYVLPQMGYRAKSIYFLKGTTFPIQECLTTNIEYLTRLANSYKKS